ncbi:MAG: MmgE/PrpD family protein [Pseudomonadota bacterium]
MPRDDGFNPLFALADWTAKTSRDWPTEAKETARRALIDIVACMIPGANEPVTRKCYDVVSHWGEGRSRTIGFEKALSSPLAALVNGTNAHALDFDDNFDPAKAHATAVIVPALLALADERDMGTDDLIDAYIVGLQILGRVGQAVNPYHRNRGWHATATLGAIGAAAASARLLRLNTDQTARRHLRQSQRGVVWCLYQTGS